MTEHTAYAYAIQKLWTCELVAVFAAAESWEEALDMYDAQTGIDTSKCGWNVTELNQQQYGEVCRLIEKDEELAAEYVNTIFDEAEKRPHPAYIVERGMGGGPAYRIGWILGDDRGFRDFLDRESARQAARELGYKVIDRDEGYEGFDMMDGAYIVNVRQ